MMSCAVTSGVMSCAVMSAVWWGGVRAAPARLSGVISGAVMSCDELWIVVVWWVRCDKWCCDVISDVVMSCDAAGRADAKAAGAKRKTRTPHSDVGKKKQNWTIFQHSVWISTPQGFLDWTIFQHSVWFSIPEGFLESFQARGAPSRLWSNPGSVVETMEPVKVALIEAPNDHSNTKIHDCTSQRTWKSI